MGPIRVALVGLTSTSPEEYEGVAWAELAHLRFLSASSSYKIVALLNSSVESAKAAVERYGLPVETKTYDNPEDLAADPSVDLVSCSVRVDKHLQTVRPSIIAGKIIFMEWPMERNVRIAQEMTELAKKHNAKTILGIQASFSPLARKLRQFIDSGKLGKILSSSYVAAMGSLGANHSKVVRYFLDRSVGGNPVSIHLGHSLEFITTVIGQFRNFESLLAVRRTRMDIVDGAAGNQVVQHAAPNNVPDQIMLHGNAEVDNAVHSLMWHGGPAFPDTPALTWRIIGEKGELLVTSSDSQSFNIGPEIPKARYHKLGSSEVEDVVPEEDEFDKLPIPARNIARVYDAFRKGEWFPDFDHGLKRHRMIDRMWKRFDYVNAVNM